ncbi:hypothetical protein HK096_005525 [Nowakowskiella sp. JEL0078]|nr:hypothetical protein HK096_005525 [Nowakowskiella sp. JEL0078]
MSFPLSLFFFLSTTVDIGRFAKRRGYNFTQISPKPKEVVVPADGTLPPLKDNPELIKSRYENRYLQLFEGVPSNKGGFGEHFEPQADKKITLAYMPVLPNPKLAGFEPSTKIFTQLVYTADETEGLSETTYLNMLDSIPLIKETLKKIWIEKKNARLAV